jgi:hypothetical protein
MTQIDVDALLEAYLAAGRAVDIGMRRPRGATAAEWQVEDDARIKLRAARQAHAGAIRENITTSAAYHRRVVRGNRKKAPSSSP